MDWPLGAGDGALDRGGGSRRELNAEMNSNAAGESPRRFLRCSAPSSLERLAA